MDYETALQKAKEMVDTAKEVVVVTRSQPNFDSMGGALAMMLGLQSLGKKTAVICPDPMPVGLSNFIGADKVGTQFGKKNFVISLDYDDGSIEKVSYNIEGKKFNLVVEHRPGYEPFKADQVEYSYQGVGADLIISVDTMHLGQLGRIYEENKDMFASKPIINVDFHNQNSNYGQVNLVDPGASSTSELVAELLATIGVKLTTDIAVNLLNAIYDATNNFQNPNVTSMAFEVASVCLKAGGKRFGQMSTPAQGQQAGVPQQPPQPAQFVPPSAPQAAAQPAAVQEPKQVQPPSPQPKVEEPKIFVNSQPITPGPKQQPASQPMTPNFSQPAKPAQSQPKQGDNNLNQPPSDWLKPKIYKGSGSLV